MNDENNFGSKNNPRVDVILPNYNKGLFLEEAINSVIEQTYKNWKLYIVDDGSNDNSFQIIEKFSNLKNIKIVKLKKIKVPQFLFILQIIIKLLQDVSLFQKKTF